VRSAVQALDDFLTKAREQLHITNHAAILESVRTDLELIRQGQRIVPGMGTVIPPGPIGAPGGSKAKSRPSSAFKTPSTAKARSRATRSTTSVDPQGLVGRRIWRYYPEEDPENPWVEGFLTDYDTISHTYTILFDPNDPGLKETTELGFDLNATNPSEYVLGDYVNIAEQIGSRRISQKPQPVKVSSPNNHGPAKRRRASVKIPANAPFNPLWLENALAEASSEDLHIMLSMLEKKEIDLLSAIEMTDKSLAMGEELEARLKLEVEFEDLCKKEQDIMDQLQQLRKIEASA